MNRKSKIVLFTLMSTLILTGCTTFRNSRTRMLDMNTDKDDVNKCFEQVLDAVQSKDMEALKAVFSVNSLKEAENFEAGANFLFDLIDSEVESWENVSLASSSTYDYGEKTNMVRGWYEFTTEHGEYIAFLVLHTIDTQNHSNVGLYALRIIKAEDEEDHITTVQEMNIAGIYVPGEIA